MRKALKSCAAVLAKSRAALEAEHKAKLAEAAEIADAITELDNSTKAFKLLLKNLGAEAKPTAKVSSCTNKLEIMELISIVMANSPQVSKTQLKKEVEARLRGERRNLSMYSKLFDECVEEVDFTTMVTEELAKARVTAMAESNCRSA